MTVTASPSGIAISGRGLVTPAGIGVPAAWDVLRSGTSMLSRDPMLGDMPWSNSGRIAHLDPKARLGARQAWRLDRFVQLGMIAAREAVADAGIDTALWDPSRVAVVLGNSLGGTETLEDQVRVHDAEGADSVSGLLMPKWMPNMLPGSVAIDLGITGEAVQVGSACASGTTAIGHARALLGSGDYDIVLAGASESAITPTVVAGLARMGALSRNPDAARASRPFAEDRDGFVIAEAAGVLVLETEESLARRSGSAPIRLRGYGAAGDAHHVTAPHPRGAGLEKAIDGALRSAGVEASAIGYVNAHGTSTPMNDAVERDVLERRMAPGTLVSSTKGATGHALAAAGAIEAIFAAESLRRREAPPTANLVDPPDSPLSFVVGESVDWDADLAMSVSAGFGGHNAALVLERVGA